MNNIKYLLISFILIFISCEKSLDVTNPNAPTEDNYWKTQSEVERTLTACYGMLQIPRWGRWGTSEYAWSTQNFLSDAITIRDDRPKWIDIHTFQTLPTNDNIQQFWFWNYKGIYFANQVIESVNNLEDINESERKRIEGEAKFLRAHYHYLLLNYYRNICLITEYIDNKNQFYPEQVEPEKVWDQIEEDLNFAKENCSSASQWPGQITKYTAAAQLGKAHMQQLEFEEASSALEEVINSGQYELVEDYWTLFTGTNENSKESLLEVQYSMNRAKGEDEAQPMPMNYYDDGWREYWPHDWLVQAYLDDTTESGEITERVWGSMTIGTNDPAALPDPDSTKPSEWEERGGSKQQYFKKYCYDPTDNGDFANTDVNIILIRYADVLLLYAEAQNELGNTGTAIEYINKVRNRVNAVPLPGSMSQSEVRQHIREVERPIELASERIRWLDLLRWDAMDPGYIESIHEKHNRRARSNFNQNRKYFPIPAKDVDSNPNVKQNPGY